MDFTCKDVKAVTVSFNLFPIPPNDMTSIDLEMMSSYALIPGVLLLPLVSSAVLAANCFRVGLMSDMALTGLK